MVDPAEIKLPWSLYLLGWGLIAGGCHSLVRIVVGFLCGQPVLDLGVVGIFVGWGLLRLRDGWRQLAVTLLGLVLWIGYPLMLLFFACSVLFWLLAPNDLTHGMRFDTGSLHPVFSVLLVTGNFAICLWAFRVLLNERTHLLFVGNNRRREAVRKGAIPSVSRQTPWQFSLGTLLMLMVIASLIFGRFMADESLVYEQARYGVTAATSQRRRCMTCGFLRNRLFAGRDKLAYAVFMSDEDGDPSKNYAICWEPNSRHATLRFPDGSCQLLDGRIQLHEIIDGEYRCSGRKVTWGEFEAYMNETPCEYSIDSLLRFVDQRRAESDKAAP